MPGASTHDPTRPCAFPRPQRPPSTLPYLRHDCRKWERICPREKVTRDRAFPACRSDELSPASGSRPATRPWGRSPLLRSQTTTSAATAPSPALYFFCRLLSMGKARGTLPSRQDSLVRPFPLLLPRYAPSPPLPSERSLREGHGLWRW